MTESLQRSRRIFWVDEEETAAFPDITYLSYEGYDVVLTKTAGEALDWFFANRLLLSNYSAFVIDIQLPINGDARFSKEKWSHGAFAGLHICELLKEGLDGVIWEFVRERMLLYTRLPDTIRMNRIKQFAECHRIQFVHKRNDESLLLKLRELRILSGSDS